MNQNQTENNQPIDLEIIRAEDVMPMEVRWLWYPYIPFGKVTLLEGDPGDGKSKLMLSLAALLTRGEGLPFVEEDGEIAPMTVIYQTTEDDKNDTVVPRFMDANGDCRNLIFIKEDKKNLTFGDERVKAAIEKYKAQLFIFDPFSSYIGDNCTMNNANETRAELNHLIQVGQETGCAIVVVAHMNKKRDSSPIYRVNGSIDIAAAARSILAVTRTPNKDNPEERYLVQVKSNLAPMGNAIAFEVTDTGVRFIEEVELTAEEAFAALLPRQGRPDVKVKEAMAFIKELVGVGNTKPACQCWQSLQEAGFKQSTINRAKRKMGIESYKDGFLWYWFLPDDNERYPAWQDEDDELPY